MATPTTSLAKRIDLLFRTVRTPDGREYTYEAVAEGATARGGPSISAAYVWQLRNGKRDNPTKNHIEALAAFFGVPPDYFFDEERFTSVAEQLQLLAKLRDAGVESLAFRAAELSPSALDTIAAAIDDARRAEGLDENIN